MSASHATPPDPRPRSPASAEDPCQNVLAGAPLLIAHRGGAGLVPENTLFAFLDADARWRADMIELDVRATSDGHCVVMHDPTVDRTTSGSGAVAQLTLKQIQQLDAGYRFTSDSGRSFPFRERGVRVPTLDEVLGALPRMRFTVEIKSGDVQEPLAALLKKHNAYERVILAGERERDRTRFSDYPGVRSASVERMRAFFALHRLRLSRFAPVGFEVVQAPERYGALRIVTRGFVRALHARGVPVHVWTVNDVADMERLLDWHVDGILSDYPDRLARVLHERVGRELPPGLSPT